MSQVTLNWRLKFRFSNSHPRSSGYSVQPGRTAREVPASQARFLTARLVDFCVPPRGTWQIVRYRATHPRPAGGTAAVSIARTGSLAVLTFPRVPEELPATAELCCRRTRSVRTRARKAAGVVSGRVGGLAWVAAAATAAAGEEEEGRWKRFWSSSGAIMRRRNGLWMSWPKRCSLRSPR